MLNRRTKVAVLKVPTTGQEPEEIEVTQQQLNDSSPDRRPYKEMVAEKAKRGSCLITGIYVLIGGLVLAFFIVLGFMFLTGQVQIPQSPTINWPKFNSNSWNEFKTNAAWWLKLILR